MSETKFVMGEDEESKGIPENLSPPLTTTPAPTQHKKPMRHHVKRRSSGRVHVAKLAPLTRSNSTNFIDTELNSNDDNENSRPTMRRSQSNRSLHKMSFDRRGFTAMTPRRKSTASSEKLAAFQVVSSLPTPSSSTKQQEEEEVIDDPPPSSPTHTTTTHNPAPLSSTAIAEPVEQTFNAVANNLVVPKISNNHIVPPSKTAETTVVSTKKQPLRSQFVEEDNHRPKPMSRTQQKLMLQKQQALSEDENSPSHPRNMSKLNKEFDMVSREHRCIRKYDDPMLASLMRCMERLETVDKKNPQITRLQLGANQHSISTSNLPSINSSLPHLEQRQIAHRHHHLKSVALTRKQNSQSSITKQDNNSLLWNATTIIDRLFSSHS